MESTVLLADDSITVQKIVKLSLAEEGIDVVTVGNGEQAVQKLHEMRPSLVLADVFMPGKDGYEVCEYIRAQPAMHDLPVILLVHAYEPFDAERAKQVGADDHLTKPFQSIRTLVDAVQSRLSGHRPEAETQGAAPQAFVAAADAHEFGVVTPILSLPPPEVTQQSEPLAVFDLNQFPAGDALTEQQPAAEPLADRSLGSADALTSEIFPPAPPLETNSPPTDAPAHAPAHSLAQPEEELMLPPLDDAAQPLGPSHFAPLTSGAGALDAGDEVLDLGDVLAPSPISALPEPDLFGDGDGIPVLANLSYPPAAPKEEPPAELAAPPLISYDLALGQPLETDAQPSASAAESQPLGELETAGAMREPLQDVGVGVTAAPVEAAPQVSGAAIDDAVIDQIVSRVVERLSTKAIETVAWEVVPELAEVIIRRQLAAQK